MKKSSKKVKKVFENCTWKKIALKLSYDGQKYLGFEKVGDGNTIEHELFKAMNRTKIINTDEPL